MNEIKRVDVFPAEQSVLFSRYNNQGEHVRTRAYRNATLASAHRLNHVLEHRIQYMGWLSMDDDDCWIAWKGEEQEAEEMTSPCVSRPWLLEDLLVI